jgi:hypothetical protein
MSPTDPDCPTQEAPQEQERSECCRCQPVRQCRQRVVKCQLTIKETVIGERPQCGDRDRPLRPNCCPPSRKCVWPLPLHCRHWSFGASTLYCKQRATGFTFWKTSFCINDPVPRHLCRLVSNLRMQIAQSSSDCQVFHAWNLRGPISEWQPHGSVILPALAGGHSLVTRRKYHHDHCTCGLSGIGTKRARQACRHAFLPLPHLVSIPSFCCLPHPRLQHPPAFHCRQRLPACC